MWRVIEITLKSRRVSFSAQTWEDIRQHALRSSSPQEYFQAYQEQVKAQSNHKSEYPLRYPYLVIKAELLQQYTLEFKLLDEVDEYCRCNLNQVTIAPFGEWNTKKPFPPFLIVTDEGPNRRTEKTEKDFTAEQYQLFLGDRESFYLRNIIYSYASNFSRAIALRWLHPNWLELESNTMINSSPANNFVTYPGSEGKDRFDSWICAAWVKNGIARVRSNAAKLRVKKSSIEECFRLAGQNHDFKIISGGIIHLDLESLTKTGIIISQK